MWLLTLSSHLMNLLWGCVWFSWIQNPAQCTFLAFIPTLSSWSFHYFCSVDPFTRKDWYDVKAPSMFAVRQIGKTLVNRTQGTRKYTLSMCTCCTMLMKYCYRHRVWGSESPCVWGLPRWSSEWNRLWEGVPQIQAHCWGCSGITLNSSLLVLLCCYGRFLS